VFLINILILKSLRLVFFIKRGVKKYFNNLLKTYKAYKRLSKKGAKFKVKALITIIIYLYNILRR